MLIKRCASLIRILIGVGFSWVSAQQSIAEYGLRGNVESLASVTRAYSSERGTEVSGFLDSELFDSIYVKFDRKRNQVLRENYLEYRGQLGIYDRTVYQFNPQNQIEKQETTLIQNGEEPRKISQRKIYYYLKNQLQRVDEFNSGRTSDQFWVTNWVYDRGKLKEKVTWMEDEIFSRNVYSWTDFHEILQEKSFSNNGSVLKTRDFFYSADRFLEKIKNYTGNETIIETFEYHNHVKTFSKIENQKGEILKKEKYNERGWVKEIQSFNHLVKQTDVYQFEYTLDQQKNWIECVIRKNNIPLYSIKRKIKYY